MQGSSPRMRGTLPFPSEASNRSRIIPAHAGNTLCPMAGSRRLRDHPRACGEHSLPPAMTASYPGSSPRMRGTRYGIRRITMCTGIIPAHAGNTVDPFPKRRRPEDHPRACGEHICINGTSLSSGGSSPRMRGTLKIVIIRCDQVGIIPAHAGNTLDCSPGRSTVQDHPRACGEHQLLRC